MNKLPLSMIEAHDIYWIYNPVQNTYLYFVLTMLITTYSGMALKFLKKNTVDKLAACFLPVK